MPLNRDPVRYHDVIRGVAVVGGPCALLFVACLAIGLGGGPALPWPAIFGVAVFASAAMFRRNRKVGFWSLIVAASLVAVAWSGCTARPQAFGGDPFLAGVLRGTLVDVPVAAVAILIAFLIVRPSPANLEPEVRP